MSARRTAVAATFVAVTGLAVAHTVTDGFEAYTLESARRLHALRSATPIPNLPLELADGGHVSLSHLHGRVLLVDFIYTNCQTYCVALGSVYARLQKRLADEIAAGNVRLVSVSFDPRRDAPANLRAYRARHSSSSTGWYLGTPSRPDDLREWLESFGVVVIPDGMGGYAHNAAIHVVEPNRRLVTILDPDDIDGAVRATRRILVGKFRDETVH